MLIGKATRKIDLPHEPGEWIEVRGLNRTQIGEAKRLKTLAVLTDYAPYMAQFADREVDPTVKETVDSYDIDYILETAIVGWSYGEFSKGETDQLDQKTAEYVACILLGLETEDEKVKD